MSARLQVRIFFSWLISVIGLSYGASSQAQELVLSSSPLYLGTQVDPNIFFMLDDSGSMDWEILTKSYQYYSNYYSTTGLVAEIEDGYFTGNSSTGSSCTGQRDYAYIFNNSTNVYNSCSQSILMDHEDAYLRDWRVRSSDLNIMYYNPANTYAPWWGFANASFTAARANPKSGTTGYSLTRDLTNFIYEVAIDDHKYDNSNGRVDGQNDVLDGANGRADLNDSHTKYTVGSSSITVNRYTTLPAATMIPLPNCTTTDYATSPPYVNCFGTTVVNSSISGTQTNAWGRTIVEEKQNIANWYQYHRRRSYVAKAAIARVTKSYSDFRYGLSLLNDSSLLFKEVPPEDDDDYSDNIDSMLSALYSYTWSANGTPLRRGLEQAGRYFDHYDNSHVDPIISACQQNYTVLFSDGAWNGSNPLTSAIVNVDGDSYSRTLADVAMYFYNKDLSDLPDQVPTTALDGNSKQHMVTFTVAFGIYGSLIDTNSDRYPDPTLTSSQNWGVGDPNTSTNIKAKIDDMWHAAFNSKGYFVSAQSTEGVANAISDAILDIADRVGSSASVATNTGSLNAGSHLFQARFDSSDWRGQLLAYKINLDGTIQGTPDWEASTIINGQNYNTGRRIISWNPDADVIPGGVKEGQGIAFRFPTNYKSPNALTNMSPTEINYLLTNAPYPASTSVAAEITANQSYGNALVNYLRGDRTNEGVGLSFRNRNSILGDIVNSDPKFVGKPNGRYPNGIAGKSYDAFITANANRIGTVFVGANDGFLHGFSEANGQEVLAYMPGAVYRNAYELSKPDYEHRYFVDGGPNVVDAYFANMNDPNSPTPGLWRTALVGTLGAGGQSVYALDVTDPTTFSEANATSLVLWEFDDGDDADLGYTFGKAQIAKMANGKWAAIFGNGYNNTKADGTPSTTGRGFIYVVDIETGTVIRKFDTKVGAVGSPSGVSTPLLVDYNGDAVVDYIYAGDIKGNMWKLNVTNANAANWGFAWTSGGNPQPLFTTASNQPITSQPQAALHPDNLAGFMIYFGTGKYIENSDNESYSQPLQTFYGIWDKNAATLTPIADSSLLVQTIDNQYDKMFDTDADGTEDTKYLLRDISRNKINWTQHKGFKLNLRPEKVNGVANTDNFGERQVSNAIVRNGRIIFTTLTPSQTECEFGGTSFLMELDYRTGGALGYPAFDLNKDGKYDGTDTNASGRASDVGIMPTVSILADGAQDFAFGSGASGNIDVIRLSVGNESYGRQSWKQLE